MPQKDTEIKKMFEELSARLDRIEKQLELSGSKANKTDNELSVRLDRIEKRLESSGNEAKKTSRDFLSRSYRSGLVPELSGKGKKPKDSFSAFATISPNRPQFNETGDDKDRKISEFESNISSMQNKINKLQQEKEENVKKRPSIAFDDLASQMKNSLAAINEETVSKAGAGGPPSYIVDELQVEVKGNIEVRDNQFRLAVPVPDQPSQNVSTIKFALRPTPTIKIIDEKKENK